MKQRMLAMLIALNLVFTIIPLNTSDVSATSVGFTGKDCTSSSVAASTIDYITAKYPLWGTWKGGGECWGYAEKINSLLGSSTTTISKKMRWNRKNIKKYLVGIKSGAHVRIENKDMGFYHSIVILKCTEKEVIWTDGNYDYENGIRYTINDFDSFVAFRDVPGTYITQIKKVKKYKYQSVPLLATDREDCKVKLYWTKAKNAKKYKVYRATSEYGSYKRIGTTTKTSFLDKKGAVGKKYYYKVKALTGRGSVTSEAASGTRALPDPENVISGNSSTTGKIRLKWDKVKDADKYKIYRYSTKTGKYKLVKTTSKRYYIENKYTRPEGFYYYMVKAYNSKRKVKSAGVEISGMVGVAKPGNVSVADKSETKHIPKITWDKVKGADCYRIYRADSKSGPYYEIATVETKKQSKCYYVDKDFFVFDWGNWDYDYSTPANGKNAYYKVTACTVSDFNDDWITYESGKSSRRHYRYTPV